MEILTWLNKHRVNVITVAIVLYISAFTIQYVNFQNHGLPMDWGMELLKLSLFGLMISLPYIIKRWYKTGRKVNRAD